MVSRGSCALSTNLREPLSPIPSVRVRVVGVRREREREREIIAARGGRYEGEVSVHLQVGPLL